MRLKDKKNQNLCLILFFFAIKKSDACLFWRQICADHELKVYCEKYGSRSLENLFYVHGWLKKEVVTLLAQHQQKTEISLLVCEEVIKQVLFQRKAYFGRAEQKEVQDALRHLVTQNFEYS